MHLTIENRLVAAFKAELSNETGNSHERLTQSFIDGLNLETYSVDAVEDIALLEMLAGEFGANTSLTPDAFKAGTEMAVHARNMAIGHDEWVRRYRLRKTIAERIGGIRNARARQLCVEAGLSGELLGIHPHNATVSRDRGQPWDGVDYDKVDKCREVMRTEFDGDKLVTAWDKSVRCY